AGPQPRNTSQEEWPAARRRVQCENRPYVRFAIPESEAGRHDPDDCELPAIELDRSTDDSSITPIASLPQALTDQRDGRASRPVFIGSESPPVQGPHAQHIEKTCCDEKAGHVLGFTIAGKIERIAGPSCERSE